MSSGRKEEEGKTVWWPAHELAKVLPAIENKYSILSSPRGNLSGWTNPQINPSDSREQETGEWKKGQLMTLRSDRGGSRGEAEEIHFITFGIIPWPKRDDSGTTAKPPVSRQKSDFN